MKDIQVVGNMHAAMQNGRPAADYDELHAGVAQRLDHRFKVHVSRRLALPLIFSAVCAA